MSAAHEYEIGAVDLGGTTADIAVMSAAGEIIRRTTIPTRAEAGARSVISRVLETLRDLASRPLSGVAMAVPASVDGNRITAGSNIPDLNGADIPSMVQEVFAEASTFVVNDLNAAAHGAARRHGFSADHTQMVVGLGTGIAVASIHHGEVIHGSFGEAGEIGLSQIPGALNPCPSPANLEEAAGGRALDREARRRGLGFAKDLLSAAEQDPLGYEHVHARLEALAFAITVAVNVIDPSHIVFYGGLARSPLVRRSVERGLPPSGVSDRKVTWEDQNSSIVLQGAFTVAQRGLSAAGALAESRGA